MQGHRNDKHVGPALLRHVPLHMSRDQPGETLLSRIFEFERDSARNVPISQHRPRAIMRRRVGEAGAAMAWPGLFEGERQSTTLTAGRAEKIHRSEEHTSELQSLMRISYAVFCLKKKQYIPTPIRRK